MRVIYCFMLTFIFSINLGAVELIDVKIEDIKGSTELNLPLPEPAQGAVKNREYTHVYMSIYSYANSSEANDYSERIQVRVRKTYADTYDVNFRIDSKYSWSQIRKYAGNAYNISGGGIYLHVNEFGGNYSLSGNVRDDATGKNDYIYLTMYRQSAGYYSVSGGGIYLNINRYSASGHFDSEQYSKKSIAAVVSFALAMQQSGSEDSKKVSSKKRDENNLRIWLSIRQDTFFDNEVMADDPWTNMEIRLRKIFDTDYNVETRIDNIVEYGRVSNFFTNRYEYTSGSTRLDMEEWAGDYTVRGNIAGDESGEDQYVRLEMRSYFGDDSSFYISDEGIHLTADRHAINCDVNPKIYSKKAVAAISALIMALQQKTQKPGESESQGK